MVNVPHKSRGGGVCIYVQESYVCSSHTSVQATIYEYAMITMHSLLTYNLYPSNIYPTHFSSGSSTFIENIFTNINSSWSCEEIN